jgi:hypothetical protein
MEDKYFIEKSKELLFWLKEEQSLINVSDILLNRIYIFLKEVAKDQRHTCAEAVLSDNYTDCHTTSDIATRAHSLAMNARIKSKSKDARKSGVRI